MQPLIPQLRQHCDRVVTYAVDVDGYGEMSESPENITAPDGFNDRTLQERTEQPHKEVQVV